MTTTHTRTTLSYADFIDGPDGETATLSTGGYDVTLWRDSDAPNPWDDWNAMLPWFNKPSRNQREFNYGDALNVTAHLPDSITWRQFRAALKAIEYSGDIADLCYDTVRVDVSDYDSPMAAWREVRASSLVDIAAELIAAQGYTASDIETIEALYNALGVPCVSFSLQGYSQGDHVEGLFVATPQWLEQAGLDRETGLSPEEVEVSKRLLAAWLWGDVWGFTIVREGEYVDSCGGFYTGPLWGCSNTEAHLFDAVTASIEAHKWGRAA